MITSTLVRLKACMTCGNQPNEIIKIGDAYAVAHFCDDFDTIVIGEPTETLDDLLINWNANNNSLTRK